MDLMKISLCIMKMLTSAGDFQKETSSFIVDTSSEVTHDARRDSKKNFNI